MSVMSEEPQASAVAKKAKKPAPKILAFEVTQAGSSPVLWRSGNRHVKITVKAKVVAVEFDRSFITVKKIDDALLSSFLELIIIYAGPKVQTAVRIITEDQLGKHCQYTLDARIQSHYNANLQTIIVVDSQYLIDLEAIVLPNSYGMVYSSNESGTKLEALLPSRPVSMYALKAKKRKTESSNTQDLNKRNKVALLPPTAVAVTPAVEAFDFLSLPLEVQITVLLQIQPFYSLLHLASVSRAFHELTRLDYLWQIINQKYFGGAKSGADKRSWLEIVKEKTKALIARFSWACCSTEEIKNHGEQQLCWAARHGHPAMAERVIRISKVNIDGWYYQQESKLPASPLFLAAQQGHYEVCELLISLAADVNGKAEDDHSTPLYVASFNGHPDVVELLLRNGANVDSPRTDLSTPLIIGVRKGQHKVVDVLLKYGANVNASRKDGITPLYIAVWKGDVEITEQLLRDGKADANAKPVGDGASPLYVATYGKHAKVVQVLIKYGAAVNVRNSDGATAAYIAAFNGDLSILEILHEHGANFDIPRNDGMTPLAAAVQADKLHAIQKLIEYEVKVNATRADGATALYMAARRGIESAVRKLITEGNADVNIARFDGVTPLNVASQNGHPAVARLLVENGAHVDTAEHQGVTPLGIASQQGHTEIVKILLTGADGKGEKANPNIPTNDNTTPLYLASQQGHAEIVRLLADSGADINKARHNGETPLHAATFRGHAEIVQILLAHNANPNVSRLDGITPLLLTVHNGNVGIVVQLLNAKADVDAPRKHDGASPLAYACSMGNKRKAIILTLLVYGANPDKTKHDNITTPVLLLGTAWPWYQKRLETLKKEDLPDALNNMDIEETQPAEQQLI